MEERDEVMMHLVLTMKYIGGPTISSPSICCIEDSSALPRLVAKVRAVVSWQNQGAAKCSSHQGSTPASDF